jgi:outer membrane immunogenic protein
MRHLSPALIAAVSAVAFSHIASAADLGGSVYKAPSPAPPAPIASWTGFYLGGDIGVGWANGTNYTFADPGNAAFFSCFNCSLPYQSESLSGGHESGVLGGLYLGYNWQFAPTWLVGVEGDFTWTDLKHSVNAPLFSDAAPPPSSAIIPVVGSNLNFETDVKWLASLRGRVGYIVANDWLFYATGGVAWAGLDQSANASCPPPNLPNGCGFDFVGFTRSPFSESTTRVGFVVGGGLEWQIPASTWGRWRARVEYLYYGFDTTNNQSALFVNVPSGGPLCNPTCSAQYTFGNVNVQTIRFGLSHAF